MFVTPAKHERHSHKEVDKHGEVSEVTVLLPPSFTQGHTNLREESHINGTPIRRAAKVDPYFGDLVRVRYSKSAR